MTTYLVTGANGFIANRLCTHLLNQGIAVIGTVRDASRSVPKGVQPKVTGSICATTDWSSALTGVDVVYHLASTVHRLDIQDAAIYQTTITAATATLAEQAAAAGVKRLVLLSTASVYGETSTNSLTEDAQKQPVTLYGKTKLQAEMELQAIAQQTALETVIVRAPMVYGKDAPGNFNALVRLVQKIPLLPFGLALEKRSFIGIDNLLDFLLLCARSPAAANKVFNVADDDDMNLKDLCMMIALILHKKCLLLPVPPALMQVGLTAIGKASMYNKLFESLRLDVTRAKAVLAWKPAHTLHEQLIKALQL
ncbi:MAG TPA: NAD-dependent epimerase/dehydratase family protein [Gammaproteobacteria bacterium]|nr:NAD-dependent epimerase/dehydratase family protein [Gammaproteobacteria bacterium]